MGIPHLITHLQPYAERGPLVGDAVVDGPGFAYHIYYICLNTRPRARNSLEATPSYEEIGRTAIAWLEVLETLGINIKNIFFDGYLPPSKLNVRLERLRTLTKRLIEFHTKNPIPCHAPIESRDGISRTLFEGGAARASLTTISPPALLVPAVMDALQASLRFQGIIATVPGEADLYCAKHLKDYGGIVFTGDSDLLVHDLGSQGAVCFFKDIQKNYMDSSVWGNLYSPTVIAERLKLPEKYGLSALTYELLVDPHTTLPNLLARATVSAAIKADQKGYEIFHNEYASLPSKLGVKVGLDTKFIEALQSMDPRISEYVLQFPNVSATVGHIVSSTDDPHVFLPFLLDCPIRTNAWEMSTFVRQLGYGLVNLVVPEHERRLTVYEHRRRLTGSSGREWQLPTLSQLPSTCSSVLDVLKTIRSKLPSLSVRNFWVAVAVYQDVEWSSSTDKPPVCKVAVQQLSHLERLSTADGHYNWDMIHFLAQLQGSYYSFRMLKQILRLVISHEASQNMSEVFHQLHHHLEHLPALNGNSSVLQNASDIRIEDLKRILEAMCSLLGIKNTSVAKKEGTKSKRRRKKASNSEVPAERPKNNPFSLLNDE